MSAVTVPVDGCQDCPFADAEHTPWMCTATSSPRDLGPRQSTPGGPWLPPPTWCPLRVADRLVTLRVR